MNEAQRASHDGALNASFGIVSGGAFTSNRRLASCTRRQSSARAIEFARSSTKSEHRALACRGDSVRHIANGQKVARRWPAVAYQSAVYNNRAKLWA